jgi:two-component system, LytTR family, sensor kinase
LQSQEDAQVAEELDQPASKDPGLKERFAEDPPFADPSSSETTGLPPVGWWILGFAVWTLLALMSVLQSAMYFGYHGESIRWGPLLGIRLLDWYTCALFLPPLVWLARRFPLGGANSPRNIAIPLMVSALFVIVKYALLLPIEHRVGRASDQTFTGVLAANALTELMVFWAAAAAIHGIEFYRRLRARERHAMILEERLTRARLDALTAQIRPHFLFNTLNSITALIHSDPEGAERMVMQLADLLSVSLRRPARQEIPLREEMIFLDRYLAIMQVRFGSRLSVERKVSSSVADALVPAFILQPLVENALEHGIARRPGPGRISIVAAQSDGSLELVVSDDGLGINDSANPRTGGIGLANTRKRLTELYAEAASLTIDSHAGEGTRVRITIPFRANGHAYRGNGIDR